MSYLKSIFQLLLAAGWMYFAGNEFNIGGNFIPPPGKFLSFSEGVWWNIRNVNQDEPNEIKTGFARGHVVLDERKVSHIFAENDQDAFFMQGYMHAMHRLWQMDFSARAAEGRISEIVGPVAYSFDQNKRRKGLHLAARMSVEHWKMDSFVLPRVQAYVDGVNAYMMQLTERELPVEFKLLNYHPEAWSLYRSALFHKSMAEILCGRDKDFELTQAKMFFKNDFKFLYPETDPLTDPVIPKGVSYANIPFKAKDYSEDSADLGFNVIERDHGISGLGSNNWAVSGNKSVNGNPILCNDPHLHLTLPSIWYEQQIHTPEYSVYGVGFPGVPGVVVGFNEHIAWGVTNAGWDVLDWYQIEWKDSTMQSYRLGEQWMDTNVRLDTIHIRGSKPVVDTVKITHWGPVVYTDSKRKKFGLAMHWILHEPYEQQEFKTFLALNRARNYEDYRFACTQFPYPAQNIAFASRSGEIALTVSGNMPLKNSQEGRFVRDGSNPANQWHGYLDPMLNPSCKNPTRGFVSSANQRSTDVDFPVYFNDGDFRSYRGAMVNRILASRDKWDIDAMKTLQYNSYSLKAELALPFLLKSVKEKKKNELEEELYQELSQWNFEYDSNSIAPVYFEIWFERFFHMVWDEIQSTGNKDIAFPNEWATMKLADSLPQHHYFDYQSTKEKEDAFQIARMSFDSLVDIAQRNRTWQDWANYRQAEIVHLSRIPAFGRYNIRSSGNEDIINAHAKIFGPSWRMIVEMGKDSVIAYGIYPGGQVGNPGSSYYDHMIDPWSQGKYYRLNFWKISPESSDYKRISFVP